MTVGEHDEAARLRADFFRRTRRQVAILYAIALVVTVAAGAAALWIDAALALASFVVMFVVMVLLFVAGRFVSVPASASRWLTIGGAVAGIAIANSVDLPDALALGGVAGLALGMVAGMALTRRRLAHDDELVLRQHRLGWLPDRKR